MRNPGDAIAAIRVDQPAARRIGTCGPHPRERRRIQPVRDVEETSERGEHLDRLDDTVGGRVPEGMKRRPSVTGRRRMLASRWRIGPSLLAANAMARTGRRTPAALAP